MPLGGYIQKPPCGRPKLAYGLLLCVSQTFEGVGFTKQKAKIAAAERALRGGFVQFYDVEPICRILQASARDVITPHHDDVIDFSADEEPSTSSLRTSVVTIFTDFSLSPSSASPAASASPVVAEPAAENHVSDETAMTSCG